MNLKLQKKMRFFQRAGPSGFSSTTTAKEATQGIDATGVTAILTGATSGIGVETARVLALHGVHVIMAVRNTDSGKSVKDAIIEEIPDAKIEVMELDLSSMESVKKFVEDYNATSLPLNILINNAGVMTSKFTLSKDNIELNFATNHIGHFLLTNLLLDTMKKTAAESNVEGRIVIVSSWVHTFVSREGFQLGMINEDNKRYKYGQSKLANILHAAELSRRFKEEGVPITVNSLHPGSIGQTSISRDRPFLTGMADSWLGKVVSNLFLKSVQQGAATTCYVALHPQVKGLSGEYFEDCNLSKASDIARDAELARNLWDFSKNLTCPDEAFFNGGNWKYQTYVRPKGGFSWYN